MLKRFFIRLRNNLCIYLCCLLNLTIAIRFNTLDWIHWLAVILCIISIILCLVCAAQEQKGGMPDA